MLADPVHVELDKRTIIAICRRASRHNAEGECRQISTANEPWSMVLDKLVFLFGIRRDLASIRARWIEFF